MKIYIGASERDDVGLDVAKKGDQDMDVQVDWPSTEAEWDRAESREIGAAHPERAWVSTDRDVWHRNPFYSGPEVPHPEDDEAMQFIEEHGIEAWRAAPLPCPVSKEDNMLDESGNFLF